MDDPHDPNGVGLDFVQQAIAAHQKLPYLRVIELSYDMPAFGEFRERARSLKSLPEEGGGSEDQPWLVPPTLRLEPLCRFSLDFFLREHPPITNVLAGFLEELSKVEAVGGVSERAVVRKRLDDS